MGLRSPVQCSPADATAQCFLRSAGKFRDAAGKARRRAGGAEVTWRMHRLGGRLVSRPCKFRPSLLPPWRLPRVTGKPQVENLTPVGVATSELPLFQNPVRKTTRRSQIQSARGFCTPSAVGIVFDSMIWDLARESYRPKTVISDHW